MKFSRHIAQDIEFNRAKNIGGTITPTVVVLHDTAGRLEHGNSANYLRTAPKGVSVHFIVERDGTIEQQVPLNKRAGHAGRSEYHGQKGVNNFSVGIEIVNPGRLTRLDDHTAVSWFKKPYGIAECSISEVTTDEHGHGLWMDYTEEQITSVEALLNGLFDYVPTLTDIVTHWYISPGRKVDTNPLFPLDALKARVMGRDDIVAIDADEQSDDLEQENELVQVLVPNDVLNMRRWPSFNPNVIAQIPDNVVVPVLRAGEFAGRSWIKVRYGGLEGWVVAGHTFSFST